MFTDADLKRLKENLATDDYVMHDIFDGNDLISLLARLQAVERYAKCMRAEHPGWYNPQYKMWRKAAGK